jgi:hypothetical protein
MGIIPLAALDGAASYTGDVLTAPLPVVVAIVLVVLTVVGLRVLGSIHDATGPIDGPAAWLRRRLLERSPRRAVAVAMLPRLPQRVPQTRAPRPANAPDVAAWGLLRGPPGCSSHHGAQSPATAPCPAERLRRP